METLRNCFLLCLEVGIKPRFPNFTGMEPAKLPNQHDHIDSRSLQMALAIAEKIDESPELLEQARQWALQHNDVPAVNEWISHLDCPWPEIRKLLLDPSEQGKRLRQSSPFAGILSNQERWAFYGFSSK